MYVIRHGETVWNRARKNQGGSDLATSVLTRDGIAQAEAMGEALAIHLRQRGMTIDAMRMVASPLARSYQTASIIAEIVGYDPIEIATDARLKEISFGDWELRFWEDIEREEPAAVAAWRADRFNNRPGGGENYPDLIARLRDWLGDLGDSGDVIVVAHGLVNQVLRGLHAGIPEDQIPDLDHPQDAFYRLLPEGIERIETGFQADAA